MYDRRSLMIVLCCVKHFAACSFGTRERKWARRMRDERMRDEQGNHDGGFRSGWEPNNNDIDARPRNWLTPVALVLLREQSSHGYELMERVAEFGFELINPGTLYRTLRQMENEGFCQIAWETSNGGPPCRMYSVTNEGEEYLASWAEACKAYRKVVDAFDLAYSCR
jgi:PadR family transcriptional regulator, regulatory protein PadR